MRGAIQALATASQTTSYMLGGIVILLAATVMTTSLDLNDIASWAWDVLGLTFAVLLASLVFLSLYCLVKVHKARTGGKFHHPWLATGVQAANGIATLALTYTLLGISLGIGSLAGQTLTPDTIQGVIRDLTENFSMAFMTTVIGLPASAFLRSLLLIAEAQIESSEAKPESPTVNHEGNAS